jgi:hypothetical protein
LVKVVELVMTALAVTIAGRERAHGPGRGQVEALLRLTQRLLTAARVTPWRWAMVVIESPV